jgi:hypothetical protein
MNRFLTSLIIASLLTACAATAPERPQADWFQRVAGKRIYGLVAVTRDLPEDAILRSPACAKRDALCLLMLQQSRQMQSATVAIYDTYVFMNVLMPKDTGLGYGDIIQIDVPANSNVAPVFVALGARSSDRGPRCDWIDGTVISRRGGVACNGWTYKSLL